MESVVDDSSAVRGWSEECTGYTFEAFISREAHVEALRWDREKQEQFEWRLIYRDGGVNAFDE
jgi:sugar diacid utilization regulator